MSMYSDLDYFKKLIMKDTMVPKGSYEIQHNQTL